MSDSDIVKFERVKKFLKNHPSEASHQASTVIDVGGISPYFPLLEPVFHPAHLYLLNLTADYVKGTPSIVASAYQLPFKDETCDIITSFDVLEHLLQPERFVSEASRVIRPDGLFILAITNLGDIYSRIAFLFGYTPFQYDPSPCRVALLSKIKTTTERGHKSVFTYRAVKALLDYYGFQVIGSSGYHYVESFFQQHGMKPKEREMGFERLRKVLGAILPTSLSEGMILFCKKKKDALVD